MDAILRFGGNVLPERITAGVLALIENLAPDNVLCHSDLHPGTVIMTAQGPQTDRLARRGSCARCL